MLDTLKDVIVKDVIVKDVVVRDVILKNVVVRDVIGPWYQIHYLNQNPYFPTSGTNTTPPIASFFTPFDFVTR